MDVNEAIRSRRTISKFTGEPLPAATVQRLLLAGIWAPNHHLTEPWRFVVLGPLAQRQLAGRFADLKAAKVPAGDVERKARIREEHLRKFLAFPTIVAVASSREGDEQGRREDYAATACAIQNIQLAAWAEGVGVKWSTAAVIRDPLAYDVLAIDPDRFEIVGLLFMGYPAEIPVRERRRSPSEIISQVP